jgi:hypothetical protein
MTKSCLPPIILFVIATAAVGQAQDSPGNVAVERRRDPLSSTLVEVSEQRVRIAFPLDSTGTWVWLGRPPGEPIRGYVWSAQVDGMDGPQSIGVWVFPTTDTAVTYSSLEHLVSAGRGNLCLPGMILTCREAKVASAVQDNRVVLTLEHPGIIARLFGTRPESLTVFRQSVYQEPVYESDAVPIRYVDPQLPTPDSATWAEAAKGRRKYLASITSIGRSIAGIGWLDDLWLAVGDSMELKVKETICHYDSCGLSHGGVADSGWSVADSDIVRLRSAANGRTLAYGRRPGRTTIQVRGLHGASDTLPSIRPPDRRLRQKIVVGRPVTRIAIVPRPDTVQLGDSVTFRARAFDRHRRQVRDVPIEISIDLGPHWMGTMASNPTPADFRKTGIRLVVAAFRELADTLRVTVVEARP